MRRYEAAQKKAQTLANARAKNQILSVNKLVQKIAHLDAKQALAGTRNYNAVQRKNGSPIRAVAVPKYRRKFGKGFEGVTDAVMYRAYRPHDIEGEILRDQAKELVAKEDVTEIAQKSGIPLKEWVKR